MATFQARVEDYIGTFSDTQALSDWLTSCARKIIDITPMEKLEIYASENTDDGSTGVSIEDKRFVRAHKSGYGARMIPASERARVLDSNSLEYATSTSPVVYIENGVAYVKPSGGTIIAVDYPSVSYGESNVTNFPDSMEQALVLYAAIHGANTKMKDELVKVSALSFSTQTAPTAPTAPSFTYTDATGTTVSTTEADISLISAPTYTKPTVSLDAAPTVFSLSASAPSAPLDASYSYSDATLGTYTATTIGSFGTAPTYTKPTTSASFTDLETYIGTDEDLEKAEAEVANQRTRLENFQMDLYNELNEFNASLEEYKANVQKALEQARLDQERLMRQASDTTNLNLQNKIQTLNAAIQLYRDKLGKYANQINSYQAEVNAEVQEYAQNLQRWIAGRQTDLTQYASDIQNELNEFNKEVEVYRQNINNKVVNAQLLQQKLLDDAQRADNIELANKAKDLEKQVSEYIQKINKFQSEISNYQAQVNEEVQRFGSLLQSYNSNIQGWLALIESLRKEYNQLLTAYVQ